MKIAKVYLTQNSHNFVNLFVPLLHQTFYTIKDHENLLQKHQ